MRTLSADLLAAQHSSARRPYLKVEVWDYTAGVPRPRFIRLYTGTEPDHYHDVLVAPDGSLLRARTTSGGTLYVQRVSSPGPGSDFSSWTSLGTASSQAGISLCRQGSSVHLFYVGTNNLSIYRVTSTDSGATWSSPVLILTPAVPAVIDLAADTSSAGVIALFYVSSESAVYVTKYQGGSWSNPAGWPHGTLSITGVDCSYQGDWNLSLAAQPTGQGPGVWSLLYGDGSSQAADTWSDLMAVTSATSGSQITFKYPFNEVADVFRLSLVEVYSGTVSYSRPLWSHSVAGAVFADNLWREPVPFDLTCDYGLGLASDGGTLWLSTPFGVWQGDLVQTPLDLTADLVKASIQEHPLTGSCALVLDNSHGKYATPGSSGLEQLGKGSEVRVSPGYYTASGVQVSPGPRFWITGWGHRSRPGTSLLVVRGVDAWGLLAQWRARHQRVWEAGTLDVPGILKELLARVGLALDATGASATALNYKPRFTVHPDEHGHVVVLRLLRTVPDVLLFRDAVGILKEPTESDAVDYAYGTAHPLEEGRYGEEALEVNRAQVFGAPGMAEAFSWSDIAQVYDRLAQVHDLNLSTTTQMQDRASAILRQQALAGRSGEVVAPVNCGQELYDVVEITDGRTGVSPFQRRLLGLILEYSRRGRPSYRHRLALGGK